MTRIGAHHPRAVAFFQAVRMIGGHFEDCKVRTSMSRAIDLMHLGRERVICAFEVNGLVIDPGPSSCLDTLLDGLEDEPRALLLTHIHLDHAGAAGHLARIYPSLQVYVHERGAPHVADPSKLWASASRLYGDDMERLWGSAEPVDRERIHILEGGETDRGQVSG